MVVDTIIDTSQKINAEAAFTSLTWSKITFALISVISWSDKCRAMTAPSGCVTRPTQRFSECKASKQQFCWWMKRGHFAESNQDQNIAHRDAVMDRKPFTVERNTAKPIGNTLDWIKVVV